ncbi:MAG: class I SAM-dependent methyltransferase [Anaerolineae bacterium]
MPTAVYDAIDDYYLNFVQFGVNNPNSLYAQTSDFLLKMAGDRKGKTVLDLCCGEGQLAREMVKLGARVTGIDVSQVNITAAREQAATHSKSTFFLDDAQSLAKISDLQFDLVMCKMALMDIPNIDAAFKSVKRVLKPTGRFLTALLHPCFETPFTVPFEPIEQNENGRFQHHRVQRYFEEGHWSSGGTGVRGRVGAHHRKLSTLINSLQAAGIQLVRLEEPQFLIDEVDSLSYQWSQHIPGILFIAGQIA